MNVPHPFEVLVIGLHPERQLSRFVTGKSRHPKCDWYQLGGMPFGVFSLFEGRPGLLSQLAGPAVLHANRADQARKGDIDFATMREFAREKARTYYDSLRGAMGDWEIPNFMRIFHEEMDAELNEEFPLLLELGWSSGDYAMSRFCTDPAVVAIAPRPDRPSLQEFEFFESTREEFAERAAAEVAVPSAYVKDFRWFDVLNSPLLPQTDVAKRIGDFNRMLDALAPEILLTMYTCHINSRLIADVLA